MIGATLVFSFLIFGHGPAWSQDADSTLARPVPRDKADLEETERKKKEAEEEARRQARCEHYENITGLICPSSPDYYERTMQRWRESSAQPPSKPKSQDSKPQEPNEPEYSPPKEDQQPAIAVPSRSAAQPTSESMVPPVSSLGTPMRELTPIRKISPMRPAPAFQGFLKPEPAMSPEEAIKEACRRIKESYKNDPNPPEFNENGLRNLTGSDMREIINDCNQRFGPPKKSSPKKPSTQDPYLRHFVDSGLPEDEAAMALVRQVFERAIGEDKARYKLKVPQGHVAVKVRSSSKGVVPEQFKAIPKDILPRFPKGKPADVTSPYGFRIKPKYSEALRKCKDKYGTSEIIMERCYEMYRKGSVERGEAPVEVLEIAGNPSPCPECKTPGVFQHHGGIDLAFAEGTPVVAPRDGKVLAVLVEEKGFGHYVLVDHGKGHYTLYAHLREASKLKEGDVVIGNSTVIGFSGHSGPPGTASHLHFEHLYVPVKDRSVAFRASSLVQVYLAPVSGIFAPIIEGNTLEYFELVQRRYGVNPLSAKQWNNAY